MDGMESVWIFSDLIASIASFIPAILGSIVLLLVGWIIGNIIGRVTKEILKKLKADMYFKFGKGFEISKLFSVIISWIIYLAFIQAAVQVLGISALTKFFGDILAFIPGLLEGMIIILVGYVIAKYVQAQIVSTKFEYSDFIGKVIFFFTVIIAISLALPFVGIDPSLINNIILILVASVGVGIAIAIGLGLKDTVDKLARRYVKE
jgi:hypothetical protein